MTDSTIVLFGTSVFVPWYGKQLLIAALIGLLIGLERELKGKPASLRTFSFISFGSCLFTILSVEAAGGANGGPYDLTRIAAQIVSGIGFLGGGVIFKTADRIEGITTGALIWVAAAFGMACGFNKTGVLFWGCVVSLQMHLLIFIIYEMLYFFRRAQDE